MQQMLAGPSPAEFLGSADDRFWFVAGPPDSAFITIVDPDAGTAATLFDVERTREGLQRAGAVLEGRGLPFESFEPLDGSLERVLVVVDGQHYVLDRNTYAASRPDDSLAAALARREPRPLRPGLFRYSPPIRELPSPDGRWLATVIAGDLWLRSPAVADSIRLTRDATSSATWDLEGALWSEDATMLAAFRVDRSVVPSIPLVDWTAADPLIEWHPFSRVGQPIPRPELHIANVVTRKVVRADLGAGDEPYVHIAGWNRRGGELYVMRMNRLMNRLELLAVDAATGTSREVIAETSDTFLWGLPFLQGYTERLRELQLAVPLGAGDTLLWTSERDGGRRIYLFGASGEMLHPVTPDTLYSHVLLVDTAGRTVYFTAFAPSADDPYARILYRTRLDGSPVEKLFDLPDIAHARLSPSGRYLVIARSGIDEVPVMEVRRGDGALVSTVWSADTRMLERLGWQPPERFTATAADGETVLHGMLFRPTQFDPAEPYPVIESIYAGPHQVHTPPSMMHNQVWMNQWLAEQGYVVFTMDGRGTPHRGKAFQDFVHGRLGQFEIDDHAHVLEQLAAARPYMDIGRVGIYGHSMGGYFTIRALLTRPELYKVGVASAPNIDLSRMRVPMEAFMGCLPDDCPDAYAAGDNTPLASRLEGKLLIIQGTHDTHVPFGETMRMVDALTKAGRPFDLVVMPGHHHVSMFGQYWMKSLADYFAEHLR